MPDQPPKATVRQLAYKIKGTSPNPSPRFCFFLGAGASVGSGIPLAGAMTKDFADRIIQQQCPEDCTDPRQRQAWLQQQPWYVAARERGTLYSDLFEHYEEKERGRQFYIEQMIEGKTPSLGYIVLAHLMAQNYINTVLTTNFDDLIYKACSTYTDLRPAVYAYGGMITDLRITNPRPRILKLHGDYLYSKLKNSESELAHQDPNMSRYVSILLNEYGLVVVGYSGCDQSVVELLRKFPPNNDLYWCTPAGSKLPEAVRSLLVDTGGFQVEINGFDQMMNEIRAIVGVDVPKLLGSLEARQDQMIDQLKAYAQTYSNLSSVLREIYDFRSQDAVGREQKIHKDEALLHYVNAIEAWQKRDFTRAEAELRSSLERNPDDFNARIAMSGVLCQAGKFAESEAQLKIVQEKAAGDVLVSVHYQLGYLYMVQDRQAEALAEYSEVIRLAPQVAAAYNGAGLAYLKLKRYDEAAAVLRKAVELDPTSYYAAFNLASVLALKGDPAESKKWWEKTRSLWLYRDPIDPYNQAVIDACLGNAAQAGDEMRQAIQSGQPGLAHLALQSVLLLESAPDPPPAIALLRQMLEQAAGNAPAPEIRQTTA